MDRTTENAAADFRTAVRSALRDAWIAARTWLHPRIVTTVARIERALGVPEREWYDRVDMTGDQSFPASDPPSHSSPRAGAPNGH